MLQLKQMYEMNILKVKHFIILQNILFVKDCLSENDPGSFNDKFHPSKLPPNTEQDHHLHINEK